MSTITRKYTLEGLDCANCAMKKLKLITNITMKTVNIAVVVMNTTTNIMSMNIITKMANIAVVSKNITTNIIIIAVLIIKQENILYKTSIVLIVL